MFGVAFPRVYISSDLSLSFNPFVRTYRLCKQLYQIGNAGMHA